MLNPTDKIFSALVEVVAQHPNMSVKDIATRLSSEHAIEVSLPTLYRKVSTCVSQQLFVRRAGRVSLNLVWASWLTRFASKVSTEYNLPEGKDPILPAKDGEERLLQAGSLHDLDGCWNHALVALGKRFPGALFRGYNARAWYPLGMRDTESQLYGALSGNGGGVELLLGKDSFLDRYGLRILTSIGVCARIQESLSRSTNPVLARGIVWTVEDYSIEFVMPNALLQPFEFFFAHIDSMLHFNAELFSGVFLMKQPCRLTIRRSRERASYWNELLSQVD
jgi:hypothetical protein